MNIKKILSLFIVIIIFFGFFISAIDNSIDNKIESIEDKISSVNDIANKLNDDEERGEYLKQEWKKILDGTPLGNLANTMGGFMSSLNYFWELILDMKFEYSWSFFMVFFIWLFFVNIFWNLSRGFRFYFFFFEYISMFWFLFFILLISLISWIRLSNLLASLFVKIILTQQSFVWQMIYGGIIILILIVIINAFRGFLKGSIKRMERKRIENIEEKSEENYIKAKQISTKVQSLEDKQEEAELSGYGFADMWTRVKKLLSRVKIINTKKQRLHVPKID